MKPLKLKSKFVGGIEFLEPRNKIARIFTTLLKRKVLKRPELDLIKSLGFEVIWIMEDEPISKDNRALEKKTHKPNLNK